MKSKDERSKVNLMTFTYLLTEYRINIDISMFRQCRILGFVDIQCISVQDWRLWLWIYIHGYPPPTSSSSLSSWKLRRPLQGLSGAVQYNVSTLHKNTNMLKTKKTFN